jgi:branched-chain amino acid transport system substrate-binding protein
MSDLILAASETVEMGLAEVFAGLVGDDGWLFKARCDRLTVGSPISLSVPFGGIAGDFRIYGRIAAIAPDRELVIEHSQPWVGRIRVRAAALGPRRSRVRLTAEVGAHGVAWLTRRVGFPDLEPRSPGALRIGLLTSKSGPGAVYALATENTARLAVEEFNADGGIRGRHAELVVGDDGTDPALAALETKRLLLAGCEVIIACVTSASFAAVQRTAVQAGVPAIQPLLNEGGGAGTLALRLGERPAAQLGAAIAPLMRTTGGRRWFLVGHTYSWSLAGNRVARQQIPENGGRVVGETRTRLGVADYGQVIERIRRSGADLVLSTLVGGDEVEFERQCYAAGLRSATTTLSLVFEEGTREHVGAAASFGVWSAMGYFRNLPTTANLEFARRYAERFGPWAPALSTTSESVYTAIRLYGQAAGDLDPARVLSAVRHQRMDAPRGALTFTGRGSYEHAIHLARSEEDSFRLVS